MQLSPANNSNQGRSQLALAREADRRAGSADAMRQTQIDKYIEGGGRDYTPATVNGRQLPTYGFGPQASDWERQNASANGAEQADRLQRMDSRVSMPTGQFQLDPSD